MSDIITKIIKRIVICGLKQYRTYSMLTNLLSFEKMSKFNYI